MTGPEESWRPVHAMGSGYAPRRPWTVQKSGRWFMTSGRVRRYATREAAQRVADALNRGETP